MPKCSECGFSGPPAEFALEDQADESGASTVRRCPGCGGLIVVDDFEERERSDARPWGLTEIWGRRFSKKVREGDADEM